MTPSATPVIAERLAIGDQALEVSNFAVALEQFSKALRQEPALDADKQAATLLKLGRSFLAEQRFMDAATVLNQLIALQIGEVPAETYFWLGQAYAGQNESEAAIKAFTIFLAEEPQMGGYVYPLIAQEYQALGDQDAAIQAYESGLEESVIQQKEVETRMMLADAYLAVDDTVSAIVQYDAIHDMVEAEETRGQMTYLAGAAELDAGNVFAAHERFQKGVELYPGAYESYLGLVELIIAEVEVDQYQRGLVDYYAAAYAPAVEVLQTYIAAEQEDFRPDAHLFLALSFEALGDTDAAFAELDNYATLEPADGLLEQAKMRVRAADITTAVTLYQRFVESFPDHEDAPLAAWWLAAYSADLDDIDAAITHFTDLADNYPEHIDAPEALYVAANLAFESEDFDTAVDLWTRSATEYPSSRYGSASLLALMRLEPGLASEEPPLEELLGVAPANTTYPALRAHDLANGNAAFNSPDEFTLSDDEASEEDANQRLAAETWLAAQFELDSDQVSSELSPELRQDARFVVGRRLWQLGQYEEAKRELEALRMTYEDDPLSTYQLALFFRNLGLYHSSIIAGAGLLRLADTHELEAPLLIGRLVYPVYYADLILALSEQYGFDPRLQFSLVRQESLFESFARSGAAAQGLSQVIPDTGAWIAEQLQWPDYENEDLYKPYVGLTFGAFYLAQQLDYFDGTVHAALAAYNAGPGNAIRWYKEAGGDLDQFIDTVDFNETKAYVERIYAGYNIYSHLYDTQRD